MDADMKQRILDSAQRAIDNSHEDDDCVDRTEIETVVLAGLIALLKEQEPVKPRVSSAEQRCGNCNKVIEMDGWVSCPWCGKQIDWKGRRSMLDEKYPIIENCAFDREYRKWVPTIWQCGCCYAKVKKTDKKCWHCRCELYLQDSETESASEEEKDNYFRN